MAQTIDLDNDAWNVVFKKGDSEYRIDTLVYTSLLLALTGGKSDAEEPAVADVVKVVREALQPNSDGLTDHDCWAMSVRLGKVMTNAGNA
jgi:hypothetical protein